MTDLLSRIEEEALHRLDDEAGHVEADVDEAAAAADRAAEQVDAEEGRVPAGRLALALAFPVLGAAVMVGGVFEGIGARFWAAVAGGLGIGLAALARRVRSPLRSNLLIVVGLFAIGLLLLFFSGPGNVPRAAALASEAAASGDVLRPPVAFTAGWFAIVGWLMGITGFAALWVAAVIRKPSVAVLVPLPVAAVAGISVPEYAQIPSGVIVLALYAVGLGFLASARQAEEGADLSIGYEVRKLAKGVPVIAAITAGLLLLAQTDFLFPQPRINPAEEPQKPKTVPLEEVEDRVLFEVSNPDGGPLVIGGPWRVGVLDVYDGSDWRLPAFDDARIDDVPDDGIVQPDRRDALTSEGGLKAEFRLAGLGGAALPSLPNTVGVLASGPLLAYDGRAGTLRVAAGQAASGTRYTIAAAALPTVEQLRQVPAELPEELVEFTEIPAPPPAVQALLTEAETQFDNGYDRFAHLQSYVLDNVVAVGRGEPVAVPPARVQEILDSLEASPFEIVATQALLARWLGLPSRIAYGFDGGDQVGDSLEIRPRHGASFPEVWFGEYGWLPFIATPRQAEPSLGEDTSLQQFDPEITASNEAAVELYLPTLLPPPSGLLDLVRNVVLVGLLVALVLGCVYLVVPVARKSLARNRRRAAARRQGPRARVALAYAEWRDHAADFGYRFPDDTPLAFLDRFVEDAEHDELAWLTTRVLWGDLRDDVDDDVAAAAEELSRALRRRLSTSQPGTMRFVAAVSRLSLKDPFLPRHEELVDA